MKPPLVLSTLIGGMVLVGATLVGTAYLHRRPAPTPAPGPGPVAQAPPLAAPPVVTAAPPPQAMTTPQRVRVRTRRRACPVPAVYHARRLHRHAPMRLRVAGPVYGPSPVYGPAPVYAPPPPAIGWYGRPGWRVGWRDPAWRGPGWLYTPRWAYGPHGRYGPGWRRPWRDW